MSAIPCDEDFACDHGFYPYCPTCDHGLVIQSECMREDECKWICLLDPEKEGPKNE